jgi:mono/diheme cytochrome c family protein
MKRLPYNKLALALAILPLVGCIQQSMSDQPRYKPLQASTLFQDGRSSRPLEAGTVSRNWRDDPHLLTGKDPKTEAEWRKLSPIPTNEPGGEKGEVPPATVDEKRGKTFVAQYVTTFPMPVTKDMITRGQQRFNIYCSVCHGFAGSGDGMIVQRGFTKPPSLVHDSPVEKDNYSRGIAYQGMSLLVPDAPVGYYFDVISRGFGAMPEHATQIPVEDRWAIAAYLRALQKSQHFEVSKMPAEEKKKIEEQIEAAKNKKGANHEGGAH